MTTKIKLTRDVWQLDEAQPLGPPGGFGEVFRGTGRDGDVAIKRLKLTATDAAHREMTIGQVLAGRSLNHVVPVLDYGQDAETDRYYLVMPICEYSLHDVLKKEGHLGWEQAKAVALDIISGLSEVGDIVHRDLKPGNVLWHKGRWQIADFGIAKFVEDSTSLETLRHSWTPAYAAPEQWEGESPTRATDIYALGCILHAMMNGSPPFSGDLDSIRRAHLYDHPPDLKVGDTRLNGLVHFMLRKTAPSRPSLERCATVIADIGGTSRRRGNQALAEAAQAVAREAAAAEARRRAEDTASMRRAALAKEAIGSFNEMMRRLFDEIAAESDAVSRHARAIVLGSAHIIFDEPEAAAIGEPHSAPPPPGGWDVVAFSAIQLRASDIPYSDPSVYTFSASVVFAKTSNDPHYRWREFGFFNWGRSDPMHLFPVALNPKKTEFWLALSHTTSGWELAYEPMTVDAEDEKSFRERWISLFAKAAQKKLRPPTHMPLTSSFFK